MRRKAIIFGVKGTLLTNREKLFFKKNKPWGIILFSRNIKNILQIKKLVDDIKKIFNDKNYPILIDQEGGAVSRLNEIVNFSLFSQEYFGRIYKKDKDRILSIYKNYIDQVCSILNFTGININYVFPATKNKSSI